MTRTGFSLWAAVLTGAALVAVGVLIALAVIYPRLKRVVISEDEVGAFMVRTYEYDPSIGHRYRMKHLYLDGKEIARDVAVAGSPSDPYIIIYDNILYDGRTGAKLRLHLKEQYRDEPVWSPDGKWAVTEVYDSTGTRTDILAIDVQKRLPKSLGLDLSDDESEWLRETFGESSMDAIRFMLQH